MNQTLEVDPSGLPAGNGTIGSGTEGFAPTSTVDPSADGSLPPLSDDGSLPPLSDDGSLPPLSDDGTLPPLSDDGSLPPLSGGEGDLSNTGGDLAPVSGESFDGGCDEGTYEYDWWGTVCTGEYKECEDSSFEAESCDDGSSHSE